MSDIDLQPFCSTDPSRPYLHTPSSKGKYTYATNGHIMVRVAKRADAPEQTAADLELPLAAAGVYDMRPIPQFKLPDDKLEECFSCERTGHAHSCPDCECPCEPCGGKGMVGERFSVSIGKAYFDGKYIALLLKLPTTRVPFSPEPRVPMPFHFDGGIGVLMPMSTPHKRNVEEPT